MLKKHPKGLFTASMTNLGERFGFYTMLAILVLFLQSKFGLDETGSSLISSFFLFGIYMFALVGGIIADRIRNYKGTIFAGMILMVAGYVLLAIPSNTPVSHKTLFLFISCFALFIIAFGNGLFKGNLQALIGQMYDNPKYRDSRDSGFSLFYMFINVGAMFAPFAATGVRNWWVRTNGFEYNSTLPGLCHQQIDGTITSEGSIKLGEIATKMTGAPIESLTGFANNYLNIFTEGFHYAFAVAILAMLVSMVVFTLSKKLYPDVKKVSDDKGEKISSEEIKMGAKEIKERIYALFAVFGVVIFFWFSFHQNSQTLTFFARDYVNLNIFGWNFSVEDFQAVNPLFIVILTPVIMGFFTLLRKKGIEPSTPKKIAIGMFITALAFLFMSLGSVDLPAFSDVEKMGGLGANLKVSAWFLVGVYLTLTVAELFISPLGISFVSKVAPPHLQGIMQGAWLGATALGNQLLFIGAILYKSTDLWIVWSVFIGVCLLSMFAMLFMLKRLEAVAK